MFDVEIALRLGGPCFSSKAAEKYLGHTLQRKYSNFRYNDTKPVTKTKWHYGAIKRKFTGIQIDALEKNFFDHLPSKQMALDLKSSDYTLDAQIWGGSMEPIHFSKKIIEHLKTFDFGLDLTYQDRDYADDGSTSDFKHRGSSFVYSGNVRVILTKKQADVFLEEHKHLKHGHTTYVRSNDTFDVRFDHAPDGDLFEEILEMLHTSSQGRPLRFLETPQINVAMFSIPSFVQFSKRCFELLGAFGCSLEVRCKKYHSRLMPTVPDDLWR